jgi:adhesin/invasin
MNLRGSLLLTSILCALCLGLALGCNKATPVAPAGTTLAITANPSRVSLNGTSTITVFGQKANGSVLDPGTTVRFSTDKGSIDAVATIQNGQATAIFRGDGSSGTATITVTAGASTTATTKVVVGQSDIKPTVLVSVNPSNIPVSASAKNGPKSTATVTVIARNSDGTPAIGQTVILTSSLGTLTPDRPVTGADGTATTTLTAGTQPGTATVTAIVGSSDAATTTLTIRDSATAISLQAASSTIPASTTTLTVTAFVVNSQGQPVQGAPVTFQSERGTFTSTGVVLTDTNGVATNTLTFRANELNNVTSFKVTASTPTGTGQLISSSTTITVQ